MENESSLKEFYKSGKGDGLGWGLTFVWIAIILILDAIGVTENISWWNGWSMFFFGAGIITMIGSLICLGVGLIEKASWGIFFGLILLALGLGGIIRTDLFWPFLILGIGILILLGLVHKKTIEPSEKNKKEVKK